MPKNFLERRLDGTICFKSDRIFIIKSITIEDDIFKITNDSTMSIAMNKKLYLLPVFLVLLLASPSFAQLPVSLDLPKVSPKETRSINIGYTKISFEYSSVAVKGRKVWGDLVPYGRIWRTGANENTIVSFSDDVMINGEPIAAGSYALHTIPSENEWVLIFSHFTEGWGSFFYDESEDALRIRVEPKDMDSKYEWMKFSFDNYTASSVDIALKWAHKKIPFRVEIPMEQTFAHIENQLRSLAAFSWHGWYQGAEYTLNNSYKMEKGLAWADRAMQMEKNVQTMTMKSKLLLATGENAAGLELAEEMGDKFGDEWRTHYNMGEIYQLAEMEEKAIKHYSKALKMNSNQRWKDRIQAKINSLKSSTP
jgi:hypothetical protein